MSDMTSSLTRPAASAATEQAPSAYAVEETHWGYIIRMTARTGRSVAFAQWLCMMIGAGFLAAAIGLWLLPAMVFGADALFMRFFATVVFGAIAALLLWYSSRGVQSEIQVDNSRGEVREVVRNHAGRMTLIGSYGFDSVGGVYLEPSDVSSDTNLVLRYRAAGGALVVASGRDVDLILLRDRIAKDVMVNSREDGHIAPKSNAA